MKTSFSLIFLTVIGTLLLSSCNSDDLATENLYTFQNQLVGEIIQKDSSLSEFRKLAEKTKLTGLLNSYGEFTCFVPDNAAMRAFYQKKGKQSLNDFTEDSLKTIIYDHIINGNTVLYIDFVKGRLFDKSMSDRFFTISFNDDGKTYVNSNALIIQKDVVAHNGVVHKINQVLDPLREGIVEYISREPDFKLFYEALIVTGLADSLLLTVDENYEMTNARAKELEDALITTISSDRVAPRSRKFGYTVLMESDETYRKNGINNLNDLRAYAAQVYNEMYPQDAGISSETDRRNSLNRFIAYHLINKELSFSKFISDYDTQHMSRQVDLTEYLEPMCPNTLIEVTLKRSSGETNLFNLDPATGKAIRIKSNNYDKGSGNGVYHEIDNILTYNPAVEAMLSNKRLRFDVACFFPELTNNNMRGRRSDPGGTPLYRNALPHTYLQRFITSSEHTVLCYSNAHDYLMNFQGDEFFLTVPKGKLYDFKMITPPVPAGTYEVRFGYQGNGRRGVAQFYVNDIPAGVPVNLNNTGENVDIGYERPGFSADDPLGFQNDKMMRNRGYMKGPNSFKAVTESWYAGSSARFNSGNLRKILGIYHFPEGGNQTIMVKGLSSGQFQIDFLEFVPTSVIEQEDTN